MYNRLLQTHISIGLNPIESYQQNKIILLIALFQKKKIVWKNVYC